MPEAQDVLARLKQDIAQELGISKKLADLGPSGVTYAEYGKLGGQMVKRLLLMAKGQL
ncbi:MAG TPA: small, acid-soluble spore protein, alpha/beta type [Firmicutes bacterium]|nr:small, acid-soluble spore protein, alpha/beta type [Bacillota bacterium]